MKPLIIGTRGSPLALAQTEIIRTLLRQAHPALGFEVKIIKTSGDQFHNLSLVSGGGKGLFTKEIEEQLLRGAIDVAVHSMKDLPTELPAGLIIGAVPPREAPHDVLIAKRCDSLAALPRGAGVGTSSVRRRAQLLAGRPDLQIEEIRGNVETRLRKLAENPALEAVILAAAGLKRLGLWEKWGEFRWHRLGLDEMIPAVGQGMIACEIRENDFAVQETLAAVNDAAAMTCSEAERAFLKAMGGGCQVPYAGHATVNGQQLRLIAAKFSPDGREARRTELAGTTADPLGLGERAARELGAGSGTGA